MKIRNIDYWYISTYFFFYLQIMGENIKLFHGFRLILLLQKELFFIAFDEEGAAVSGLPVKAITVGFTVLTALTIAMAIRIVGLLMVSSLMILPVVTAMRVVKSFRGAILTAVIMAEVAVAVGLFASFYLNLAPGGTIVMTSVLLLLVTLAYKR
ncbi:metal ABC transporter permease [Desulfotomaculum nigrificans]|uniref:metal ABC transporter permease n=1 Tax=Desulfotomaculum nigrificans TaxID=1565 RepID=UPI000310DEFF|nr:metal ABC transporter permease [Desulfotomaculum nigrificans]